MDKAASAEHLNGPDGHATATTAPQDPEAGQTSDNTSPLDAIASLRMYFEHDEADLDRLRWDSDWLRDKANWILSD